MPPPLVLPPSASSVIALALPRLPRASPPASHRPMGQDGRLSADGKRIRPTPHPNDTTDPRSNISSWPGPNLNGAQSNGSSSVTTSSPPTQYYILNRPTPNPTTKPTSPPLIFHGYTTFLSRSTMHSQHSIPLTDTSTTT